MYDKLIEAVLEGLHYSDIEELRGTLEDIAKYGADAGFGEFVYYSDTVKFFKRNRAEIINLVKEYAADMDTSPFELVASFKHSKDDDWVDEIGRALYGRLKPDDVHVPNELTWFAVEEVARYLVDNPETLDKLVS